MNDREVLTAYIKYKLKVKGIKNVTDKWIEEKVNQLIKNHQEELKRKTKNEFNR